VAKIQILTGSVGGRALQTAMAVAQVLNDQGHDATVNTEPTPDDLLKDPDEALLVCCSTTGKGELPPNIFPVFRALDDETVNLVGRVYGVIALGDSGHHHFANAGTVMEKALRMSGAKRVGDICILDASKITDHSLAAVEWTNEWITKLAS
jgi:MioC protein